MGSIYDTTGRGYEAPDRAPDDTDDVDARLDDILGPEEAGPERDEVDEAYDEYVEETRITERQGKTFSDRRDVLESIIRERLDVEDSRLIGSFTRDTMVGPLARDSDADVMIVLDADTHREWVAGENGPMNALRAIKRQIQNDPRFSETDVEIDQNVVKVKYHDSTIEIAPAFRASEVPNVEHPGSRFNPFNSVDDGYAIPDTHGGQSWMGTNPREYKNRFEARDGAHDGRVSGLTRSMKKWAKRNNVPVRSYHMEIMVYNYFQEKAESGQPVPQKNSELTQDFVDTLPDRIRRKCREPIYDERVDSGMSRSEKREAMKKARRMREKIDEAERLREEGKTKEAKQKLKEVHGDDFK